MNPIDHGHFRALAETGYWGRRAAGAILYARDTGRFGFALRSRFVEQPLTFGTIGGAIDPRETSRHAVRRELFEELGLLAPPQLVFLDEYRDGEFSYTTYLAIIPHEFAPDLDWESSGFVWVDYGEWPQPLHPGLAHTLGRIAS